MSKTKDQQWREWVETRFHQDEHDIRFLRKKIESIESRLIANSNSIENLFGRYDATGITIAGLRIAIQSVEDECRRNANAIAKNVILGAMFGNYGKAKGAKQIEPGTATEPTIPEAIELLKLCQWHHDCQATYLEADQERLDRLWLALESNLVKRLGVVTAIREKTE